MRGAQAECPQQSLTSEPQNVNTPEERGKKTLTGLHVVYVFCFSSEVALLRGERTFLSHGDNGDFIFSTAYGTRMVKGKRKVMRYLRNKREKPMRE